MNVTKRMLGYGYVGSAGVVLSLALVGHAVVALRVDALTALVAVAGLVPALALAGAVRWLPATGIDGERAWTVAQWSGLGIAALTLVNFAVLTAGPPASELTPALLATGVALGGLTGLLVGTLLELRSLTRRLQRGNAVLGRVIQHNLRNDLTVVLGHVGELERTANGASTERLDRLAAKVDDMVATAETARQIEVALARDRRSKGQVDVVPPLEERLAAVRRTHPDGEIETEMPERCFVLADWFIKSVLDNLIDNVVRHAEGPPALGVTVERRGDVVLVRIADDCPPIPENELTVFSDAAETSLEHATGLGLSLVRFVMESYGGTVSYERRKGGGNTLELRFQAANDASGARVRDRVCSLVSR